jgi:RNA polymerase sigma factor (sigma-70 family)
MLHHDPRFIEGLAAERRTVAASRRPPADAAELERLVSAAAAGNGDAWKKLVERFAARLRAVTRAYRLTAHDTDDVAQTTWLRLHEHIHDLRDARAVGAWLETTARRESLRRLSTMRREQPTEDDRMEHEPVAPLDEARLVESERRVALTVSLQRLPDRDQRLLEMLLLDDSEPSYEEISRALDMPIGSIGPTRGRALGRLRRDARLASLVDERAA